MNGDERKCGFLRGGLYPGHWGLLSSDGVIKAREGEGWRVLGKARADVQKEKSGIKKAITL